MANKKKVEQTYEIHYCSACKGIVKYIIEDVKEYLTESRCLGKSGDYICYNSDSYDGETLSVCCREHGDIVVKPATVNSEVFKLIFERMKTTDVVHCSADILEHKIVDRDILFTCLI